MRSPTSRKSERKTALEPVKCTPANSGWSRQTSVIGLGIAGDEVDHAVRQPGLAQDLEHEPVGEDRGLRRLPHDRVAHQRRRRRQVAADRREVERRDGVDEALEAALLEAVVEARRRDRLHLAELLGEVDVEAPEVGELGGRVDLGLAHRLALPEHRRGVDARAPRAGQQVGRAQQHGGAVGQRPRAPVVPRRERRVDRLRRLGRAGRVPGRARRARAGGARAARARRPCVRSRPPITSGTSGCSPRSCSSAARIAARSGEPGA